jgi:hypothetical protein
MREILGMTIDKYIWLGSRWWFWLIFIVGMIFYWHLFRRRVYKMVGGKLFVRHGQLGRWLDVEEHLQKEHSEEMK